MTLYVRSQDGVTPASGTFDIDSGSDVLFDAAGPYWVSFAFWTDTDDALAGAFTCDLEWVDPTGETRVFNGVPISLADPTGYHGTAVFMVQRQSNSSTFRLVTTLIGTAESSLVSTRLCVFPDPGTIQTFP